MSHFGLFIESRFSHNQGKTDPVAGVRREDITILADTELPWSNLATQPDMSISIQDCHAESMLYDVLRDSDAPRTGAPHPCHLLGIFEVKHSDPFLNIPFDECRFKSIPSPRFNYTMIYGVGDKDRFEFGLYSPLYDNPTFDDAKRNGVIHRFDCAVTDEHFVAKMLQYCDILVAFMTSIYQSQGSYTVAHNSDSFLSHFPDWDERVAEQPDDAIETQMHSKMNSILEQMNTAAESVKSSSTLILPETPPQDESQTQTTNPEEEAEHTQRHQQAQPSSQDLLIAGYIRYARAVLINIKGPHLFKRTAGQSRLALPHIQRYQRRTPEQRAETANVEAVLVVGHYLNVQSAQSEGAKVQKESHRASQSQQHNLNATLKSSHTPSQTPKSSRTTSQAKSPKSPTTTSKDGAIPRKFQLRPAKPPTHQVVFNLFCPTSTIPTFVARPGVSLLRYSTSQHCR